ncbi:MAG: UDP-N-acetylmuramate dehydrogenase, partial [Acidimicrobiaceae bacterium]|nr:UDP-N-acetylmuramate dehydrogenase [Acidimicrobiaceae bacterium]
MNDIDRAAMMLGDRARRDAPIGPLTTYRVGGAAARWVEARSLDDLLAVGAAHRETGLTVLVVGNGSNLLIADDGFRGIAVTIAPFASSIGVVGTTVHAGGAVSLPVLARRTVAAALTGLEWAVGVPGSVGGAVRMNAGGHGADTASRLVGVRVLDLATGEDERVEPASLQLHFRGSALLDHHVVLEASFGLAPGDRDASERELADIVRWRREHQPGGQNCGSVFVNPVPGQLAAGELIDSLGLRGLRLGTAHVSLKHANFIQADE